MKSVIYTLFLNMHSYNFIIFVPFKYYAITHLSLFRPNRLVLYVLVITLDGWHFITVDITLRCYVPVAVGPVLCFLKNCFFFVWWRSCCPSPFLCFSHWIAYNAKNKVMEEINIVIVFEKVSWYRIYSI